MVKDKKTGKCGFVDKDGVEVIPCRWRGVGDFSEYMGGVQDDSRKCGYVDIRGQLVIPCIYDEGWPFFNGLARVQKRGWKSRIHQHCRQCGHPFKVEKNKHKLII